MIIEFENADENIKKILHFIDENHNIKIIHVHANNFLSLGKNNIPKALEITFQNINYFKNIKLSDKQYPIANLDFPNNPRKEDIILKFSNN